MDDPDPGNIIIKLIFLFLLILVNAFFAMSEIAIITLNDNKVRKMAEDGNKQAAKVLTLIENPSSFFSTLQIGVTLAGFLTSASAAENFSEPLAKFLVDLFKLSSSAQPVFEGISLVIVTIAISYFSLVLGELAPKRIAMQKAEAISFKVVGILLGIKAIMRPFIKILSVSTNVVVRLLGFDPNAAEDVVTEEEIRMMVSEGEEKGVIEESQKEMINNIFEFDDQTASDVMTHRTDFVAVSMDTPIPEIISLAIKEGYSRIPVYEEDIDDIKGVLYVKDLLPYTGRELPKRLKLQDIIREAEFMPESKRCDELLNFMTEKRLQMVFISDEYGGVTGLVTIEDLLEEIVGSIQDEYDDEEEDIEQVNETTFELDGTAELDEISEMLGIQFPESEYDTIGGFIMDVLGRIPEEDEQPEIDFAGCRFKVNGVSERRILSVTAEKLLEETEDTE